MSAPAVERPTGLSTADADAARRRGAANVGPSRASRGYATILRTNLFSFYNDILFVIGVALLALGRYNDALVSVGLGLVNALLSSVQEIRAKRKLDRLQLLGRSGVAVLRDGAEVEIAPHEVVRGDVLVVRAGTQLVVDGPVLGTGTLRVDESLLTGESDPQRRAPGDELRSGSVCVEGDGYQLARDVGVGSYANRVTADARRPSVDRTVLQGDIDRTVRMVMVLVVLMSALILAQAVLEGLSLVRIVQISAVLSGLVPYGLFLLIAVAYTVGATRIVGLGALVQYPGAVEAVSTVDVLCTDKTGTLTTGHLVLDDVVALGPVAPDRTRYLLGVLAHATTAPNSTTEALRAALPADDDVRVRDEVPFTSALRWSGVATDHGVFVLGALEALDIVEPAPGLTGAVVTATGAGLRALVFARADDHEADLHDADGRPRAPRATALAVVVLRDELRDDVVDTVAELVRTGVRVVVLSGDDPRTVAALAGRAGVPGADTGRAGSDLDGLTDAALDDLVASCSVFGRVAPEQKVAVVAALRRRGHHVAMIGDGVNDAGALKAAHVGVAMRSGSAVTRDVADVVLLDDSFAALLPARREGRRIVNGIAVSMYVFLSRVAAQSLIILGVALLGIGFPYSPAQVGLTLFTVGVPTFFLTLWADANPPDPRLLRSLVRFVLPAGVVTAACGIAVYAVLYTTLLGSLDDTDTPAAVLADFSRYTGLAAGDVDFVTAAATIGAQTGLSTFVSVAAFGLILFLAPPTRLFAAWTAPVPDRRPAILVVVLLVLFVVALALPATSSYFGLTDAALPVAMAVVPATLLWFALLSACYRYHVLDRLLGLSPSR